MTSNVPEAAADHEQSPDAENPAQGQLRPPPDEKAREWLWMRNSRGGDSRGDDDENASG